MLRRALLVAGSVTVAMPMAALAQEAKQQRPQRRPNGGRVVIADGHPVEFVASTGEITFYPRDDDYSAQIFLLGAEFTRAWAELEGSRVGVQNNSSALP